MKRFALLLLLLAVPAFGQALRPTVTKSFTPSLVEVNQISILTITITNPNGVALTGASMIDNFPAGLTSAGAASGTCGSGTAVGSATSLSLSGGILPANASCIVTAPVHAASPGSYENSTGAVFSTGPASITFGDATLEVVTSIPTLSPKALLLLGAMLAAIATIISRR